MQLYMCGSVESAPMSCANVQTVHIVGRLHPPHALRPCRWRATERSFPAVLHMLYDVAACLDTIHQAGLVHRNVRSSKCAIILCESDS